MNTVIFCNGVLSVSSEVVIRVISKADLVIAADGGVDHLKKLNLKPGLIIGDMDSIKDQSFLYDKSVEKKIYPLEKDQTDTELAVQEAFRRGSSHITLLGATGGRFDHTLANLELLKKYPGCVTLIDNDTQVVAINDRSTVVFVGEKGSRLSLFWPEKYSPSISTKGLKYNLNDEKLVFTTQGTSNIIQDNPAFIKIASGLLLICADVKVKLEFIISSYL